MAVHWQTLCPNVPSATPSTATPAIPQHACPRPAAHPSSIVRGGLRGAGCCSWLCLCVSSLWLSRTAYDAWYGTSRSPRPLHAWPLHATYAVSSWNASSKCHVYACYGSNATASLHASSRSSLPSSQRRGPPAICTFHPYACPRPPILSSEPATPARRTLPHDDATAAERAPASVRQWPCAACPDGWPRVRAGGCRCCSPPFGCLFSCRLAQEARRGWAGLGWGLWVQSRCFGYLVVYFSLFQDPRSLLGIHCTVYLPSLTIVVVHSEILRQVLMNASGCHS